MKISYYRSQVYAGKMSEQRAEKFIIGTVIDEIQMSWHDGKHGCFGVMRCIAEYAAGLLDLQELIWNYNHYLGEA